MAGGAWWCPGCRGDGQGVVVAPGSLSLKRVAVIRIHTWFRAAPARREAVWPAAGCGGFSSSARALAQAWKVSSTVSAGARPLTCPVRVDPAGPTVQVIGGRGGEGRRIEARAAGGARAPPGGARPGG